MKKWKIVVPVVVIVLFVAWYAFRPERLLINQSVREKFPATPTALPTCRLLSPVVSTAFCIPPKVQPPSIALATAVVCFALRISALRTARMFIPRTRV